MRTCAIINLWDGVELLPYCVDNWLKCVDDVIVIFSRKSNYGEPIENWEFPESTLGIFKHRIHYINWEPGTQWTPIINETEKRNYGLIIAESLGCTHFVTADVDEFYEPDKFRIELKRFENSKLRGLVCASQVYFKSPSLTIGLDITRVPFIHETDKYLKHEFNKDYPFAWEGKQIRIDPTRSLNITCHIEWSDIICHHYSWIRKNFEIKIRNSTARANIERSTIRQDLMSAKEGYYVEFYGKTLIRASVDFNIPEFDVSDIHQPPAPEAWPKPKDS